MVAVRAVTRDDADAIGRVQAASWRAAYTGVLPESAFDVDARRGVWRKALAREPRPGSAVFVAEADGEVVGFTAVGAAHHELEGIGELYSIYVEPGHWGTGAGLALIRRAEESLRMSGFAEAILWVLEGNERAERFYRAGDWVHDGDRNTEQLQGAEVTRVRYRKPL